MTKDTSSRGVIYLKDQANSGCVRDLEMFDNLTWGPAGDYSCIGLGGQYGSVDVEIDYCKLKAPYSSGRAGAMHVWAGDTVANLIENIWIHNNSLHERVRWEGSGNSNMADDTEVWENNVINIGSLPVEDVIYSSGNVEAGTYLDATTMLLLPSSRTAHLGKGAEVAS